MAYSLALHLIYIFKRIIDNKFVQLLLSFYNLILIILFNSEFVIII